MGVDVAPVVQAAAVQPTGIGQHLKTITCAKKHQTARQGWKGQKVDLVFSKEHPADRQLEPGKVGLGQGDVVLGLGGQQAHASAGIQQAKAHAPGLVLEAVALAKLAGPGGAGINKLRGQGQVQQLTQHTPVRLDELTVDTGQIHLAQIDARARVGLQPGDNLEQARPGIGQGQRVQGVLFQPRQQHRLLFAGVLRQSGEALGLFWLADQRQCVVQGIEPDFIGYGTFPEHAVAKLARDDAPAWRTVHRCVAAQGFHPRSHIVKALGQLSRVGPGEPQAPGRHHLTQHAGAQQLAFVPEFLDLGAQVGGGGPGHACAINRVRPSRNLPKLGDAL
ncbi:hypothetical protein GALL_490480 [mine drainage metagenome]|uniref:Uncharacterized protein n=1 Tax=mine drainage metagenome TaxID=410659 RepID=A0A1J5PDQ8_9ZZZZ